MFFSENEFIAISESTLRNLLVCKYVLVFCGRFPRGKNPYSSFNYVEIRQNNEPFLRNIYREKINIHANCNGNNFLHYD